MFRLISAVGLVVVASACSSGGQQELGDSGVNPDGGVPDSGAADSGVPDAGTPDAGMADAGSVDTWSSWASPELFVKYCTSCHTPGQQGDPSGAHLDFTGYADVASHAAEIRCGTAVAQDPSWGCAAFPPAKQFPIGTGPKPTDAERNRLVAWIDAGYPQ
jgi:hypothetical protein